MVYTKFMRCVFLQSLDPITREQGLAGVMLKLSYAINNVWRVELYLHVPASQHTRVKSLVPIG